VARARRRREEDVVKEIVERYTECMDDKGAARPC